MTIDYKTFYGKVDEVLDTTYDFSLRGCTNENATRVLSEVATLRALHMCPHDIQVRLKDSHGIDDMTSNDSLVHAVYENRRFHDFINRHTR